MVKMISVLLVLTSILFLLLFMLNIYTFKNHVVDILLGTILVLTTWFLFVYCAKPTILRYSLYLMLFSVLGYSGIYTGLLRLKEHFVVKNETDLNNSMNGLYFSVVTASTVGYGDITPVGTPSRGLVVSQIVFSFLMLGVAITKT
jgi:hypothetical protein